MRQTQDAFGDTSAERESIGENESSEGSGTGFRMNPGGSPHAMVQGVPVSHAPIGTTVVNASLGGLVHEDADGGSAGGEGIRSPIFIDGSSTAVPAVPSEVPSGDGGTLGSSPRKPLNLKSRIEALEKMVFEDVTRAQKVSLRQRVASLEEAVSGEEQTGSLEARVSALEEAV